MMQVNVMLTIEPVLADYGDGQNAGRRSECVPTKEEAKVLTQLLQQWRRRNVEREL
jgi:hypothetical protein